MMIYLGIYLLAVATTIVWVALDRNAIEAFEIFRWRLHQTAREMGMYQEWFLPNVPRAALLVACVAIGVTASATMYFQNPWGFGELWRAAALVFMLSTSLAVTALPQLHARLLWNRFLDQKSEELSQLVSLVSSEDRVRKNLEPAEEYDADEGWSAWHPKERYWKGNLLWEGLFPVVYLRRNAEPSLIVPVDWEYFLAWNLPSDCLHRGGRMPLSPDCSVTSMHNLRGRKGWSVIQAELADDELEALTETSLP